MKLFQRGLFALISVLIFQTQLSAEYLHKDELINNPQFSSDVEVLGSELYSKTGIALKLIMLKKLPDGIAMIEYLNSILQEHEEPTILLAFSQEEKNVDILANDASLYKYFNKKQVLSPVASSAQAFVMAVIFAKSIDEAKELISDTGGTILPLLGNETKGSQLGKYSAAMFNGYLDIAVQIAKSKNVELENGVSDSSKYPLLVVKVIFYSFLVYAIFLYIRNKFKKKAK